MSFALFDSRGMVITVGPDDLTEPTRLDSESPLGIVIKRTVSRGSDGPRFCPLPDRRDGVDDSSLDRLGAGATDRRCDEGASLDRSGRTSRLLPLLGAGVTDGLSTLLFPLSMRELSVRFPGSRRFELAPPNLCHSP